MTNVRSAQLAPTGNSLLNALPITEYEGMLAKMEVVKLRFNAVLYARGDAIRQIYFPISGLVSLLMVVDDHSTVDVGMAGSEGMVGLSLFLGVAKSLGRAIVQGSGEALRITAPNFVNECEKGGSLPRIMMRYTRSMLSQVAHSAPCYQFHKIEERLAGRLVMMSARMRSNELEVTHDLLSQMLGVRREGITIAVGALQKEALISNTRGNIRIIDLVGLEAAACNCYKLIRDEETS
jgi:CRP-like cAMP-binding protein